MAITKYDYPAMWPGVTGLVQSALTSGNEQAIMTGLQALFALTKKYEYEMEEDR